MMFEYKVRCRHRLGWKEFTFYATTDIEEFLNRNSIDYVRNATDTVENRLFKENKRLNNIINEALGIANERVNYYHHIKNKEVLEDWSEIFGVLVKRDNQELKGSDKE